MSARRCWRDKLWGWTSPPYQLQLDKPMENMSKFCRRSACGCMSQDNVARRHDRPVRGALQWADEPRSAHDMSLPGGDQPLIRD